MILRYSVEMLRMQGKTTQGEEGEQNKKKLDWYWSLVALNFGKLLLCALPLASIALVMAAGGVDPDYLFLFSLIGLIFGVGLTTMLYIGNLLMSTDSSFQDASLLAPVLLWRH